MGISKFIPSSALRAIDRVRLGWYLSIIRPANVEYVKRFGLEVKRGPFKGMRYIDGVEATSTDLIGKVAGTYERELHPSVEDWVAHPPSLVLNVGCAEGYYAVGLARAIPGVNVIAYDISSRARSLCVSMARLNDVSDRVQLEGECTPATLSTMPASGVALLCDCEGYEKVLLDPDLAPNLRSWRILVELHDFVDSTITDTITARFADTHQIELITSLPSDSLDLPDFEFMSSRQRRVALTERPVPMNWAHLRPHSNGSAS
jgi:hypothetical protein